MFIKYSLRLYFFRQKEKKVTLVLKNIPYFRIWDKGFSAVFLSIYIMQ